jgi:hypothetical protein
MKYTADCPSCSSEFEISGVGAATSGLKCPKCGTGFVPEKIHKCAPPPPTLEEIEERERTYRWEQGQYELNILRQNAGTCMTWGVVILAASLLMALIGFANDSNVPCFLVAGGLFPIAIIFIFFCQCLHIRAALQKLYLKDWDE